jgi:hypothetical protein
LVLLKNGIVRFLLQKKDIELYNQQYFTWFLWSTRALLLVINLCLSIYYCKEH